MNDIDMILAEARAAVELVEQHQRENMIILICGMILLAALCRYIWERWTWIPRKKHNRVFRERF